MKLNYKDLIQKIYQSHIGINYTVPEQLPFFDKIPVPVIGKKYHGDIVDRSIIIDAIQSKCTLISHDAKFTFYRKYGLDLLEI
jgi:PIN domain nuclease of toxin-antitoxin system